jgi:homoserine dehydrogenase
MKNINIALLGFGTVGRGVFDAINMNNDKYIKQLGVKFNINKILVSDINKKRDIDTNLFTNSIDEAITDEIDIVIEVMGGIDFAKKCILKAFENGKSVVSANKDLIANHSKELYESAYKNKVFFMYEASVCGGIPIIRTIEEHLSSEQITEVTGIVNGTTNFILTKMYQKYGLTYETVLSEAQELGYAEADPTADVEGLDAARKIAILSSLCFSAYVEFKDVYTEGITKISTEDIKYAKKFDYNIKLLGISKEHEDGIEAHVYPAFIPNSYQLSKVNDAFNAVYIKSNVLGSSMYYGAGAGSLPTASAVMSDVVDITKKILKGEKVTKIDQYFTTKKILSIEDISSKYYIRMLSNSGNNTVSKVTSTFEKYDIKTLEIITEQRNDDKYNIVIITEKTNEKLFRNCIDNLKNIGNSLVIENIIRIEESN